MFDLGLEALYDFRFKSVAIARDYVAQDRLAEGGQQKDDQQSDRSSEFQMKKVRPDLRVDLLLYLILLYFLD
jgi:hypothetical protein